MPSLTEEESKVVRPSSKLLIQVILDTDEKVLAEVAPNSISLKRFVKVPLFILTWSAGMCGSLSMVFGKVAGEILKMNGVDGFNTFKEVPFYLFIALAMFSAFMAVIILNMAMRNYNQLEVMPIYQSANIVNALMCGLFILNE